MMKASYLDPKQPVEKKVENLLAQMTIEEKIAQLSGIWVYEILDDMMKFSYEKANRLMTHGIGQITRLGGASNLSPQETVKIANQIQKYLVENTRLGIPALIHEESCSGYMAKGATIFPQTIGVASTWNPKLVEKMASVIREQMKAVGARQALAPLLDVTRDPRWGRTEETFGEDPYLVMHMGVSYIRGLQTENLKEGVIATGKHFVGYGNSEGGMNWAPAHIPMRELYEIFLYPFEAAVKEAKLGSIMPGYHELDGIPCHKSKQLLTDILRKNWGFDGIVVSDYFAINQLYEYHRLASNKKEAAKLALEAGVDVELPSTDCYGLPIKELIEQGDIDIDFVNDAVRRILKAKFLLGLFENPYVDEKRVVEIFDTQEQRQLAYKIAQESIVLLKNESNLLPLKKDLQSIAVIGPNADNIRNMIGDYAYPCHIESLLEMREKDNVFNTPLPEGLEAKDIYVPIVSVLQGIKEKVSPKTKVIYAKGCDVISDDTAGFNKAVEIAKQADVAIVVVGDRAGLTDGCTSGESRDRADLNLPGVQEQLVKAIYETGTPVVVVLINGRPMSISWLAEKIPAIIEAWLPGEEGGRAIADVIFGDYNPGGKLPISIPCSVGQLPVYYYHKPSGGRTNWKGDYVESSTKPLYPFGYGLSYTEFLYSNLNISNPKVSTQEGIIEISVDVKNIGKVKGDEVVQLYIHREFLSVTRPVKELKGFKRITLDVGEQKTVIFQLSSEQLGFYNEEMEYVVEPGRVEVMIGSSSEDIRLFGSFEIVGEVKKTDKKFMTQVRVENKL
ncbi:glycoside hydrolase family 3 N-terminal domain-containing protein [Thermoanaerobacter sp. CM-CNRG TB177]|jgi:beta-glucosidase|uniref:glycoside hydrolase family 3 N-terminal domain-containing protein n=1 Tax=Thermoanaerobacter sp. CM-CNRG TB177 TaxID=2800659 RepID=UPI001BDDE323|nr:glycoside hydrolase family 3 N-terminal domain-containing protein [Thermoanaerobacter sp. CM-CNRG TB177]MBT1280218.1 glycoside hydrolase family 3 C-terminal domain-containing protein [Thermoanaerobacter sp. CM-CNRG TB177]MDK2814995.1 beta-glucosidase [Thermoanaerobacter sp.]